jgi:hypothetical protein
LVIAQVKSLWIRHQAAPWVRQSFIQLSRVLQFFMENKRQLLWGLWGMAQQDHREVLQERGISLGVLGGVKVWFHQFNRWWLLLML